jgi:hypothetical protein
MAKQVVVTDDITGEPDAETHVIILDGKGIEIDLAGKSIERLVKALAPFWAVGSEGDYEVTRRFRGKRAAPATNGSGGPGRTRRVVPTEDLLAYVGEHPGSRGAEIAEHFGMTSGAVTVRLRGIPAARSERRHIPGLPGRPVHHWYLDGEPATT